jgi:hypothetical protein
METNDFKTKPNDLRQSQKAIEIILGEKVTKIVIEKLQNEGFYQDVNIENKGHLEYCSNVFTKIRKELKNKESKPIETRTDLLPTLGKSDKIDVKEIDKGFSSIGLKIPYKTDKKETTSIRINKDSHSKILDLCNKYKIPTHLVISSLVDYLFEKKFTLIEQTYKEMSINGNLEESQDTDTIL